MGLFSILERSMTPLLFSYSCYQVSVCKETPLTVLPRWCSGKGLACQCRRRGFNPWVQKVPWSRKWQPAPVFLPGKSHGQRSLVATVQRVTKSQTRLNMQVQINHYNLMDYKIPSMLLATHPQLCILEKVEGRRSSH